MYSLAKWHTYPCYISCEEQVSPQSSTGTIAGIVVRPYNNRQLTVEWRAVESFIKIKFQRGGGQSTVRQETSPYSIGLAPSNCQSAEPALIRCIELEIGLERERKRVHPWIWKGTWKKKLACGERWMCTLEDRINSKEFNPSSAELRVGEDDGDYESLSYK